MKQSSFDADGSLINTIEIGFISAPNKSALRKRDNQFIYKSYNTVLKQVNSLRTNTTTNADDSELFFDVEANGIYVAYWSLKGNERGGLKIGIVSPSGTIFSTSSGGYSQTVQTNFNTTTTTIVGSNAAGDYYHVLVTSVIRVGSTAGQVKLQWSQSVANGEPTTIERGSYVEYYKVN